MFKKGSMLQPRETADGNGLLIYLNHFILPFTGQFTMSLKKTKQFLEFKKSKIIKVVDNINRATLRTITAKLSKN